jgi:hypothetical protein
MLFSERYVVRASFSSQTAPTASIPAALPCLQLARALSLHHLVARSHVS